MGDSVAEGTVLEWRSSAGDAVAVDDPLVEISTDKVDAELPSPVAGTIAEILVEPDATVAVGTVLCRIAAGAGARPPGAAAGRARRPRRPPAPAPAGNGAANATPVAARDGQRARDRPRPRRGQRPARAGDQGGRAGGARRATARPPADRRRAGGAEVKPIRGPAATLARFMDESRSIPTATSFRTLAVDVLDARRKELKAAGQKLSFTHLIAWAIVQAARDMPVMGNSYAEEDGKPQRVVPAAISLGLAVDVERKDGTRSLVVPVLADASELGFADFVAPLRRARRWARATTRCAPDAYQGANITLTNPGGIGTVASVPRLMPGQGTIVATGAIGYPPGLAGVDPGARCSELGVQKVMTMTSTYDHRVIQGAESGAFLRRIDQLLQGEDGFYDGVFEALGLDAVVHRRGRRARAGHRRRAGARRRPRPRPRRSPTTALLQAVQAATSVVKAHRMHGHLAARLDPLGSEPVGDPALDPATVNLTAELMRAHPGVGAARGGARARRSPTRCPHLRETYTGTIAYEIEHISDHEQRVWLRQAIESGAYRKPLERRGAGARCSSGCPQVEALESYLHKAFLGKKQFSIEGLDALVPMLDETIELASERGRPRGRARAWRTAAGSTCWRTPSAAPTSRSSWSSRASRRSSPTPPRPRAAPAT